MSAMLSGLGSINGIDLDAFSNLVTRSAARIARETRGAVESGDLIGPGCARLQLDSTRRAESHSRSSHRRACALA